jgi:hypothetical protein
MILCEECRGAIETSDPDVVYAVELREVARFVGTELVEGTGFYFHDECFPWDSPRYREKPRPARAQQVA